MSRENAASSIKSLDADGDPVGPAVAVDVGEGRRDRAVEAPTSQRCGGAKPLPVGQHHPEVAVVDAEFDTRSDDLARQQEYLTWW